MRSAFAEVKKPLNLIRIMPAKGSYRECVLHPAFELYFRRCPSECDTCLETSLLAPSQFVVNKGQNTNLKFCRYRQSR